MKTLQDTPLKSVSSTPEGQQIVASGEPGHIPVQQTNLNLSPSQSPLTTLNAESAYLVQSPQKSPADLIIYPLNTIQKVHLPKRANFSAGSEELVLKNHIV